MRYYFPSDTKVVSIGITGHTHGIKAGNKLYPGTVLQDLPDGRSVIGVDCPDCEPHLKTAGGNPHVGAIPYTYDEELAAELLARPSRRGVAADDDEDYGPRGRLPKMDLNMIRAAARSQVTGV